MLNFNNYLIEVFNKAYPFKRTIDKDRIEYIFTTAQGKKGKVDISKGDYKFDFISKDRVTGWDINFDIDSKVDVTGGGEAFTIFSTVVEIAKDFVAKNKPKVIIFNADKSDQSRVNLYTAMVKRLAKQADMEFNITLDDSHYQDFILYKK